MKESIQSYLQLIVTERNWSWTLIGILYIVLALAIRGWFVGPLFRAAKSSNRHLYGEIKTAYLRNSLWGWIFFLIPLIVFIVTWYRKELFPITIQDAAITLAATASFVLSIMLHMKAFGVAAIQTLHRALEKVSGRDI